MAQYFTAKLLETLSLHLAAASRFFRAGRRKILDPEDLLARARFCGLQNIDSAGLTCKILRNKDLALIGCGLGFGGLPGQSSFLFFRTATLKILISKNLDGIDLCLRLVKS